MNLPELYEKSKGLGRLAKAIGPFVLKQSEEVSKRIAAHETRLAQVGAYKEFLVTEARNMTDLRHRLRTKYFETNDDLERLRIKRDLEGLDSDLRRITVYQQAVDYLPDGSQVEGVAIESHQATSDNHSGLSEISDVWLDRFDEAARRNNEPWRQNLLAKALAIEAASPGSLSPRVLWFVGTMDENAFHAFAALIDISWRVGGRYAVMDADFSERLPNCALSDKYTIGHAAYLLSPLGLLGDITTSQRTVRTGKHTFSYGETRVHAECLEEHDFSGILLTPLGDSVASLYMPARNEVGERLFSSWVSKLPESKFSVLRNE